MKTVCRGAVVCALALVADTASAQCSGAVNVHVVPLTQDTYVQMSKANSNFVSKEVLIAGETTTDEWRGLLQLDYSSVKDAILDVLDGHCIVSAQLFAYANDTVGVQRKTAVSTAEDFVPAAVTWNTQPGTFGLDDSIFVAAGWNTWKVRGSFEVWIAEFVADREYNVGYLMLHSETPTFASTSQAYYDALEMVGGDPAYVEIRLQEP